MPNFFRTLRQTASTYGRLEHWVKNPVYPLDVAVCDGPKPAEGRTRERKNKTHVFIRTFSLRFHKLPWPR